MTSRSQLELDALEIARRQPRLERLETQQTDLEKELGAIAKRLKLDPEDAEGWEKIREEALAEAARIREEKIAPVDVRSSTDKGVDAQAMLANNDAYGFFEATGDLVMTGPTLTNVNDFRAILVESGDA